MSYTQLNPKRLPALAAGAGLLSAALLTTLPSGAPTESYIVQADILTTQARAAAEAAGGAITHELGIIRCTSLHNNRT